MTDTSQLLYQQTASHTPGHSGGLAFDVKIRNHAISIDATAAHGGADRGPSPKDLLVSAVLGCTGMDVAALLKKAQLPIRKFYLNGGAVMKNTRHPKTFERIEVQYHFELDGEANEAALNHIHKAINDSMTRFCGVSAMLSKACPIHYEVFVNQTKTTQGQAAFTN